MADRERAPESISAIMQTCDELLASLKNEAMRVTAILRLQGYTNAEISEQLDCSVARTKQRLARIREVWSARETLE